ncbi:cation-translocating P-type ATPase [Streptomyces sp. AK02-01A]|uniref:cation-translocating P-type ATPase n=1 Tax=Streptomyces sp. AK02-01A TaxID=3028648 RepID=UPI0029BE5495|nr:cation-translocating P-type ATPase [Streptomyces sp. AK02-01A]MDX3854862.1 cation-translocating P-type ATPase [Streptomyces sp. AK02-01A]
MSALEALVESLPSRGHTRVSTFEGGRAHLSVRGLRGHTGPKVAEALERRLAEVPSVRWAVVNAVLQSVVVAVEGPADDEEILCRLVDVVEAVEEAYDTAHGPLPPHPASAGPAGRAVWALAAQAAALPLAAVGLLTRRAPLPIELASIVTIVDTQPRLRRLVGRVVGDRNTGLVLATLNAAAQSSAGGFLGLAVDAVRHAMSAAELKAHRTAWTSAEPDVAGAPELVRAESRERMPRPVPLRPGPVERYADTAGVIAGLTFAGALAVTRRTGSAASAALAAIPKAPGLAREGFACTLGGALAHSGTLVRDPEALRRLDRVRTVVLDSAALTTGAYSLADLIPLNEASAGDLAATAHRLFDPRRPERLSRGRGKSAREPSGREDEGGPGRQDGTESREDVHAASGRAYDAEWILGPLDRLSLRGRTGARARTRLERAGSAYVLGLARGDRLMAVVGAVPEVHEAAERLVAAARGAGLRVLAANDGASAVALGADATVPGGKRLAASVRERQADGTGVLVVSRDRAALAAADIGIGVAGGEGRPAWGAHLHAADPGDAVIVVEACAVARQVARRGVWLAKGASGLGSTMTLAGRTGQPGVLSLAAVNWSAALGMAYGAWSAAELLRRPPVHGASRQPWHSMLPETVLARMASDRNGLTRRQVNERAGQSGAQTVRIPSLPRAVMTELANPLTPVLVGGAALSAAVGGVLDAAIVLAVTGLSGLIGGTQRHMTDRAVRRLHQRSAVMARVVRDGEECGVPAEELVAGDVVALGSGDVVPADCRLLEGHGLEADESALTGESMPVGKTVRPVLAADVADRTSMLYEGTTVAAGRARAVVVATGGDTEAGRGASAGRGARPAVGVEHRLARITKTTLPLALGSAGAVMAAGLLRGRPVRETVGAGVGLAVASVPEGLPFLVSAAQLAAARRLSTLGVLVRDPRTIEAAGRADVLCFDKTGTLTHGRIELARVVAYGDEAGRPPEHPDRRQQAVLAAALRATPRPRDNRKLEHFTDRAVMSGAERAGVVRTDGAAGWRRTGSLPFESRRGFHATRGRSGGLRLLSVKGAPERVVELCAMDREAKAALLNDSEKLAAEGHRVLAVAESRGVGEGPLTDDSVSGLDFLGFLLLSDKIRSGAARSVRQLAEAGVHIVMITGDHPQTAESIARELDVVDGRRVVTGADLDALDDDALDELLPHVGVVARGTPTHKVRVVKAFQRLGRTVAMTGDGANDAPAIRLADVGIALGTRATPAARAAADLVVTDDRLETILAALVEGRAMWASVRQALAILLGGNLGEIAFTVLGATVSGSSPLTARQLLLVNLFTDLAPAIAVALRPPRKDAKERLLREGPESSLGTALTDEITVRAMATALGAAAAWTTARATGRPVRARTVALAALVATQLGQTLLVGWRSPAVLAAVAGSMGALAAVIQTPGVSHFFGSTPLGPVGWTIALAAATAATVASVFLPPVARRARTSLDTLWTGPFGSVPAALWEAAHRAGVIALWRRLTEGPDIAGPSAPGGTENASGGPASAVSHETSTSDRTSPLHKAAMSPARV